MRKFALLVALSIALGAAPAVAGAGCGGDAVSVVQHIFDAADTDRNGELTRLEYEEAGLQRYGLSFEESDLDADGRTTLDEYLELYERHHEHPPVERRDT